METKEQQYKAAWFAKRWAEDPQFRERRKATRRAWRVAHRDQTNSQLRHRYATDPEFRAKKLAASRRRGLKRRYGISLEEYERLLALQNGACAICRRKTDEMLCVDHCHKTGKVRGLLCRKCNAGLGCYDDDPSRIRRGADYLERCEPQRTNTHEQDGGTGAVKSINSVVRGPDCGDLEGDNANGTCAGMQTTRKVSAPPPACARALGPACARAPPRHRRGADPRRPPAGRCGARL